jgi:hypothetical protein
MQPRRSEGTAGRHPEWRAPPDAMQAQPQPHAAATLKRSATIRNVLLKVLIPKLMFAEEVSHLAAALQCISDMGVLCTLVQQTTAVLAEDLPPQQQQAQAYSIFNRILGAAAFPSRWLPTLRTHRHLSGILFVPTRLGGLCCDASQRHISVFGFCLCLCSSFALFHCLRRNTHRHLCFAGILSVVIFALFAVITYTLLS